MVSPLVALGVAFAAPVQAQDDAAGFDDRLWSSNPAAAPEQPAGQAGASQGGEISLVADAPSGAEEEEEGAPWRGSQVTYLNEIGVVSFDRSFDLTYNPYWLMTWVFRPRWWFDDVWNVAARLDISREATQADDRTYSGETWVHDLLLSAGASNFYTIPGAGIDLSADLVLTVPTSKISQARTLALGIGPGVRIGREFDLGPAGTLSLGYRVRFSAFLHRFTTGELETPIIPSCSGIDGGCDEFINTGERNTQWRVQHGVSIAWQPLEWLGVSTGFEHIVSWLYDIEADDPRLSNQAEADIDARYSSAFDVELTFVPWEPFEIGVGYATLSPQLAPDSTYYNPFYNRYSTVFVDIRLMVDGLINQFMGEGSEG
ncbi:MAG: hypothetical protein HY907_08910 [Deltaproteobacteria bacterium]|nr:hypothetical protein [Deltaproteobacteria bacterium]